MKAVSSNLISPTIIWAKGHPYEKYWEFVVRNILCHVTNQRDSVCTKTRKEEWYMPISFISYCAYYLCAKGHPC